MDYSFNCVCFQRVYIFVPISALMIFIIVILTLALVILPMISILPFFSTVTLALFIDHHSHGLDIGQNGRSRILGLRKTRPITPIICHLLLDPGKDLGPFVHSNVETRDFHFFVLKTSVAKSQLLIVFINENDRCRTFFLKESHSVGEGEETHHLLDINDSNFPLIVIIVQIGCRIVPHFTRMTAPLAIADIDPNRLDHVKLSASECRVEVALSSVDDTLQIMRILHLDLGEAVNT
mmetsp:Transcript_11489/g.23533  ORF Transcript_11489/g.23533 Transcript_11489/m.23533 type:complete len:236 (+) Transcript_11489:706-1413(+)